MAYFSSHRIGKKKMMAEASGNIKERKIYRYCDTAALLSVL